VFFTSAKRELANVIQRREAKGSNKDCYRVAHCLVAVARTETEWNGQSKQTRETTELLDPAISDVARGVPGSNRSDR
jgi:hypothetical protein